MFNDRIPDSVLNVIIYYWRVYAQRGWKRRHKEERKYDSIHDFNDATYNRTQRFIIFMIGESLFHILYIICYAN